MHHRFFKNPKGIFQTSEKDFLRIQGFDKHLDEIFSRLRVFVPWIPPIKKKKPPRFLDRLMPSFSRSLGSPIKKRSHLPPGSSRKGIPPRRGDPRRGDPPREEGGLSLRKRGSSPPGKRSLRDPPPGKIGFRIKMIKYQFH